MEEPRDENGRPRDNAIRAFRRVENESVMDRPFGSLQWKGTYVCIDLHCSCGQHSHVDGEFFYQWRCGSCGTCYAVSPYVRLVKLEPDEVYSPIESPEAA